MKTTKNNSTIAESRPRRFGKSTLLEDSFLVAAKAGESAIYQHPDYVCLTRKAYEALAKQREELLDRFEEIIGEDEVAISQTPNAYTTVNMSFYAQQRNGLRQEMRDKITALRSLKEKSIS